MIPAGARKRRSAASPLVIGPSSMSSKSADAGFADIPTPAATAAAAAKAPPFRSARRLAESVESLSEFCMGASQLQTGQEHAHARNYSIEGINNFCGARTAPKSSHAIWKVTPP